ncbi:MAG: TetR/AcrR family transcriptional regulator [Polyangiales bacterium]
MTDAGDARRRRLEEAALGVFLRYGFRKASMDEVAQAAGVSRQALYLHFATKEELFRAAVGRFFDDGQVAVDAALGDEARPLEARLLGAFDAWVGRYVGAHGDGADDLAAAAAEHAGALVTSREEAFVASVAQAMRRGGLAAAYRGARLSARQLAETLYATARGLKHGSTRDAFTRSMTVAVRAMCAPLRQGSEG